MLKAGFTFRTYCENSLIHTLNATYSDDNAVFHAVFLHIKKDIEWFQSTIFLKFLHIGIAFRALKHYMILIPKIFWSVTLHGFYGAFKRALFLMKAHSGIAELRWKIFLPTHKTICLPSFPSSLKYKIYL